MSIPYTYDPLGSLKGKNLTLDEYPTEGNFENAVSSGGVWFELNNHTTDFSKHMTTNERSKFNYILDVYFPVEPRPIPAPTELGAITPSLVADYIARHANHFGSAEQHPGKVYLSRVPYARKDSSGNIINTGSALNLSQYTEDQKKLLDNTGLKHACSTDATEGVDDYADKWAFFWNRCNYIRDSFGVKWISAIEGETIEGRSFDESKPTGVFGPPIWCICKTDKSRLVEEDDGVNPNYQLWGIGDRPWNDDEDLGMTGLTDQKKQQLQALGITENDYNLWSTAKYYDGTNWKSRPYIIDSAYCGTAEVGNDGNLSGISSVVNQPLAGNLSYSSSGSGIIQYKPKGDGGARACALSIMFDIVKNATKDSQAIHKGMDNNNGTGVQCCVGTGTTSDPNFQNLRTVQAGNIFPVVSGNTEFEAGLSVYLRSSKPSAQTTNLYRKDNTAFYARVLKVENRSVDLMDFSENPTVVTKTLKCVVLDIPEKDYFFVCSGDTEANATANADALAQGDPSNLTKAVAFITRGPALAGETYEAYGSSGHKGVIGKHDGSVQSLTNGKHPYRVQGMEMMGGLLQTAADVICVKGDGSNVTLPNGETVTTSATDYVYMYAPPNLTHASSGTLDSLKKAGYIPVGAPTGMGISGEGYIYGGRVDTVWGVWYPEIQGTSSTAGHKDYIWKNGSSPTAYRSGGSLRNSGQSGSACLDLSNGLGHTFWSFGSRD